MAAPAARPLHLFEGHGVEVEAMIVDAASFDVRPVADQVLRAATGEWADEAVRGDVAWSNELALHVIELKVAQPAPRLAGVAAAFQREVSAINAILAPLSARLMPGAMHPWMDPLAETVLWPHECSAIYQTFDRIFRCQGHGWSNLQSLHLNLPFHGDEEFARLHAAIRLVLPIIPALAAASPFVEGRLTGLLDNRLDFYRSHVARIPSVMGPIIPEPVFSQEEYAERVFEPIRRDVAPHAPGGVLEVEFTNARGAIARFSRGSIEIRLIDAQECPAADLAVAHLIVQAVKALCDERWSSHSTQRTWDAEPLRDLLLDTMRTADETPLRDSAYLAHFGLPSHELTAGGLWRHIAAGVPEPDDSECRRALDIILHRGPLARRLLRRLDPCISRASLRDLARSLCDGLELGEPLSPEAR